MLVEGDEHEDEAAAGEAAAASDGRGTPENATAGYTYRVPRGRGVGGVVGTTYIVDRTPDEVAQGLLSASNDDEDGGEGGADENETGSATDEENEMREGEGGAQGEEQQQEAADGAAAVAGRAAAGGGDNKKSGSAGGGRGKGKAAAALSAADAAAAAMVDLPRYWRGNFTPLADEDMQALELQKGEEGLEEYFDKRCVVVGRGWGSSAFRIGIFSG